MRIDQTIKQLERSKVKILTIQDLKKILRIESDNTTYKTAEHLHKREILVRLKKGVYRFNFSLLEDFELANALYQPSYISLESALNFYGILSQFPYTFTSVTPRKTKKIMANEKEFEFAHLQKGLFFGYERLKGFLIATPEKAVMDEIYFVSKGWRNIEFNELDYSKCNIQLLEKMIRKTHFIPMLKLWSSIRP